MAEPTDMSGPGRMASKAGVLLRYAGALMSLALVLGIAVWGYRLVMRDVTGIPVVRAMEGPMREAPENPGGEIALHTGLAVNEIAAMGEAAGPEDRLVLAPPEPGLTEEDLMVQPDAEADERRAGLDADDTELAEAAPEFDSTKPMSADDVMALADRIAAGSAPLAPLAEPETPEEGAQEAAPGFNIVAGPAPEVIAAADPSPEVAGATSSAPMRPALRPFSLRPATAAAAAAREPSEPKVGPVPVSTEEIPAGTSLVQLGAFESPEVAGAEWVRLNGKFGDLIGTKERLVQEAVSGGRTFFRLRATGFADLAEARRFCSALVAEDAACIPVVVR